MLLPSGDPLLRVPFYKKKPSSKKKKLNYGQYLSFVSIQVPKPEDLGVFLETEDIRMIRWVGGETTALKQMQQRLAVEYETFCR